MIRNAHSTTLRSQRLTLRTPAPGDASRMAELASDIGVARMTTSIPYPYKTDQARDFIDRMHARDAAVETAFSIVSPTDDFMGVVGFHPDQDGATELGYWLGRPYWGVGYMTEAVVTALEWARESWAKRYLLSGHFADNPASGRVLCKTGFLYTGDIRPRHSMARREAAPTRMMVWLA